MNKKSNVLQFPKEQSTRVRVHERARGRHRAVLAMSILSILMMSVLSNQWLTRPETSGHSGGRGIASFSPTDVKSEINWEHRLARELASGQGLDAHLGVKPSLRDELIYGALEGRYGVKVAAGEKIESLEFINSGTETSPLVVKDRAGFLLRFSGAFAVSFTEVGLAERQDAAGETWNLVGADRTIVGQALFHLDDRGRLSSLVIKK
ncbi:MAG: hypothetical protein KF802_04180 [Bdellovibrionaceae bacterium]|nr:hypothetical protein [Pseudobdellovibrionaceae bacterium]MBX3034242.1 hypothetical protein [Pseudobdellovibrionaceae bacterium]